MTIAGIDKLISYNSKKEKKEKAYNGYNFLSLSLNIIFYISTGLPTLLISLLPKEGKQGCKGICFINIH